MTDIEDILLAEAARWQRDIDAGASPAIVEVQPVHRFARRTLIPVLGGVAVIATIVAGLVLGRSGDGDRGSADSTTASALQGVTWTEPVTRATIVFNEHTARIFDGCTNALHTLTPSPTALVIGKTVGTVSVCGGAAAPANGPGLRSYEAHQAAVTRFYRILNGRVSWTRRGDTLQLISPRGTLTLRTDGGRAPQVTGQTWTLSRISDTDGELTGSFDSGSLRITADGHVSATDLCGSLKADATITDTTIAFAAVQLSAGSSCPNPGARHAQSIIDSVLSGTITYMIRGQELALYGRDSSALIYHPAP